MKDGTPFKFVWKIKKWRVLKTDTRSITKEADSKLSLREYTDRLKSLMMESDRKTKLYKRPQAYYLAQAKEAEN